TDMKDDGLHLMGDSDGVLSKQADGKTLDPNSVDIDIALNGVESLRSSDLGLVPVWGSDLDVSMFDRGFTVNVSTRDDIRKMTGGAHQDVFTATDKNNTLFGQGWDDSLDGRGGDDTLYGGLGADILTGGAGRDTFAYSNADETKGDVITDLASGEDKIDLSALGSLVFSEDGPRENALWVVQEGRDLRLMGDVSGTPHAPEINILLKNISRLTAADVGADVVRDGTLDISARMAGAKLHLDDHPGIHKAIGTNQDDRLVGTDRDNTLHGRDGQDRMYGEGWDDHLYGEGGNDFLQGGSGRDYLDGGDDIDTVDYSDHSAPIGVILRGARATKVRVDGQVEDALVNIENVTGGSGDDRLVGDNEANVLKGL
ncbi:MAG: hypothetical protein EB075_15005, partial [Bacteroidetes bacterium]|nr:hypothetical protein [Bacteroidota bacterium]